MAGNAVTLTFAGDANDLRRAAQQAEEATEGVADSTTAASRQMSNAAESSSDLTTKMGHLGGAVSGATDAIDTVGGSLTAVNDIMQLSSNRAAAHRRALIAVEQAQEDLNQAFRDSKVAALDAEQASIDLETANLDAADALKAYNDAVKEFGANSSEAKRASVDLKQAHLDAKVAIEDGEQATRDLSQSTIDAKTAQEDLNDAMLEANPPELQKWAENLQLVTPLLTAVVGILGLVTAAQWLWNTALFASPVTWIVLAVAAVIAGIVILAMHTKELGEIWDIIWGGITDAALWAWDKIKLGASMFWDYLKNVWAGLLALPTALKDAFFKVTGYITAPFRAAFNYVADAWNSTIGRLHWTVPSWVPGVGGNSISAPRLAKYHQGGIVSGALGAETLAILQAGERITPAGGSGSLDNLHVTVELVGDGVLRVVRAEVGKRGSVERALGSPRG